MKRIKRRFKVALGVSVVIITFFGFTLWRSQYSMGVAESYEISQPNAQDKLLIATQSSEFKDSLVSEIVSGLQSDPLTINVIDIKDLTTIDDKQWSVIVVIHTWENGRPPSEVRHFVDGPVDVRKLIVLTTSSSGDKTIGEVDGISAASQLNDLSDYSDRVVGRIRKVLSKRL